MPKQHKHPSEQTCKTRQPVLSVLATSLRASAGALLIVGVTSLAYFPSVSGEFILDDNLLLTENRLILSPDGPNRFWCGTEATDYWPVTNTSLWLEWRLWEADPTGYHVTNLTLHVAESLLVWLILRRLSIPGALVAALLFAVHPINVESVAWIAQRKNMLAMLFFLISIVWYFKPRMPTTSAAVAPAYSSLISHPSSPIHPLSFRRWYWLSLAAFLLAMLSKGSVAVLPVVLLGVHWWRGEIKWRHLARLAPFFAVALLFTGVNVWLQMRSTVTVIREAGFVERLLGAGGVIWFYLYKAVLPIDLAFVYPQWRIQPGKPAWWLPLLAALLVTIVLWRYRTAWARHFLFAWGFFCVALVPVLGFIDVGYMQYSLVADHYQHIAIISVVALVAAGWGAWRGRAGGKIRWLAGAAALAASVSLAFLTWQQNVIYRTKVSLYRSAVEKNPLCPMPRYGLGLALLKTDQMYHAIDQFRQAAALKSDYFEAYNNLGVALAQIGRPKEAIEAYRQALAAKPDYIEARNNLGVALAQSGRPRDAIKHYQDVLERNPNHVDALNNLGSALKAMGEFQQAIEQYEKALKLKPDFVDALNNLGNAYSALHEYQPAIQYYEKALQIKPNLLEAHINLGLALVQTGRTPEAIEHYRYVLRSKPDYIEAHSNLGNALLQSGRAAEAIEHYIQALRLKPELASVNYNLGLAYAQTGQSAQAITAAQKALDLARSQGQTALAGRIEDWLSAYRAGH